MLLVANGALPKMQKKILLLGVLFLLVVPLIHSGILILEPTEEVIDLGNELSAKKDSTNKSMIIEKNNENIFNITSSTPFHYIGDFSKTKEWGYEKGGYEIYRSKRKSIQKGNYICVEDNVVTYGASSLAQTKTYIDCVYYTPVNIEVEMEDEKKEKYNQTINLVNISKISDYEFKIDFPPNYDPSISNLTIGLISCWNFSDTFDDSFNDYNGVAVGTPDSTDASFCKLGKCYNFSGDAEYVEFPDDPFDFGTDTITLNGWIRFEDKQNIKSYILDKHYTAYTLRGGEGGGLADPRFYVTADGAGDANPVLNDNRDGVWYMITGVYNGTHVSVFRNGTRLAIASLTGNIHSNSYNLTIGSEVNGGEGVHKGMIDELTIWNVALNDSQISELYNNTAGMTCEEIIATGEGVEEPPPEFTSCQDGHTTNCTFPNSFSLDKEINLTCLCNISDVSWARNISFVGTGEINVSTTISFYNISPLTDGSIGWISTNGFMNQTH